MERGLEVTQVRSHGHNRKGVLAFLDVELCGCLWVRGLRVIETADRGIRLAWPDRPQRCRCDQCRQYIEVTHNFCPRCGTEQRGEVADRLAKAQHRWTYRQVVYPATSEVQRELQAVILRHFRAAEAEAEANQRAGLRVVGDSVA